MVNLDKLFSSFDLIDEIIYISDMDTYDLVYCNQKVRRLLFSDDHDKNNTHKCYELLQGLDHPCVFCNNEELKKSKRCIWTRQHPQDGKYYLLHDSIISIEGKDFRMELAVDATHIETAAVHTREMLKLESHLTDCVRHLVKSGNFQDSVDAVLQTVLNFYAGQRAYVFDYDWKHNIANNSYEICAPGVTAEINNLQNVPLENMYFWIEIFKKQSAVIIEDLETLKDDPARQDEYHDLKIQGITGIIAVPIFKDKELEGFIGVDNPKANLGNSDFLVNLAYFIGVETEKNRIVQELKDQSFRDPLTGVFNRKGFDETVVTLSEENLPIGFAVLDIDNFKMLNDNYGHDVGDEILREIANILVSVFRSGDTVYRLGGDEFAVLLCNCDASAWNIICSKIQWVHSVMSEKFPKKSITLSVGICFSDHKYSDSIFQLADDALYETKKNGRAGCSMINETDGEKRSWKDDSLSSYSRNVLEFNSTGLFHIEYPEGTDFNPRMICNDKGKEIFAFPNNISPEECYRRWIEGVDPSYLDALAATRQQLLSRMQAECTYEWNHPDFGKIYIRTSGSGEVIDGVQTLYGYHHSLKDTRIIEREDISKLLLNATSSIYFGSYYITLSNDTYYTIKNAPNERYLQVHESNASESLRDFVSILVQKEDQDKMYTFVDLQTLKQRMKNERHLDCEYVSVAEKGWCRATFIPVKYDKEGDVTNVLFQVTSLDFRNAQESQKNVLNKRTIESFYNHVPGGLVMYEWNGKQLKTLQLSKYYEEQYGDTLISKEGSNVGGPDFQRIHPDDLEEYQKAIYHALTETHHLEYVYRAWNNIQNRYVWVKLNAVSEVLKDGTSLVYAMYSDVTGQKDAELRLMKKQASLVAALSASNQLCYEYDPITHVEVCLTEDNIFHLPRVIENYPEALLDIVHPEDQELFLRTIHSMDQGETEANCNIRLLRDEKYIWYSYQFHSFYDSEKERIIVILSIMDNSEHISTVQDYEARMQMMLGITEESLSFGTINLTENSFSVIHAQPGMRRITDRVHTLEELFQSTVQFVVGKKQQDEYRKLFSRSNLFSSFKKGQLHVHFDHLYQISSSHIEWVRTCVDMLKNPSTGDIVGVCYSKSIQNAHISNILLEKTLKRDYPLAAVVYADNDEYYLFNAVEEEFCVHKKDFWKSISNNISSIVSVDISEQVRDTLTKEKVVGKLNQDNEFYYSFDSMLNGKKRRLEAGFNYLNDNQEMFLATLRDITDSVIMERLRHDNERDHLTNLYNRRKIFTVCKQLLEEHPEDQFAMLHFDIRHFRLYNTFFGEVAGDKLLCDIADMFRKMDNDYDYWAYGRIESDVFCVFFPINQNKYQKHLNDLLNGLQGYRPDFLIEPMIGIFIVNDRNMSIESMFSRASIAAKTVRSGVTNSIVFYDELMEQNMSDEHQVVNDMQSAIEQEQFKVYLQPKYSLRSNKPVGAEALVRWIHPQKGLISPAKFIPVFEGNGFISTLDRYMWEHVCQLLKQWQDAGYTMNPVSVNVSRISMYNPTTVKFLKDLVTRYNIDPVYLELELTESAYMDDPDEMKKQLNELQQFGFRILMDDFGSGFSSLNTLRELPVDCLKLDMKFLSESSTDERGQLVLASVVRMSKLLKLTTIAEGVETQEQADFLRGLGCEYAQGYLFAKPMPALEYQKLIKTHEKPASDPYASSKEHTHRMRAVLDVQSQVIEDVFPAPVALLEYKKESFSYLRVNSFFMSEFGIEDDDCSISDAFRLHLSDYDYHKLLEAYAKCAETKKQIRFQITWIDDENKTHNYVGRAAYEVAVEESAIMVVAFMDI